MSDKNILYYIKLTLVVLILYVLQTTVFKYIEIRVIPDAVFVFFICYCIMYKDKSVMFFGLAIGIFIDLTSSGPFGLNAIFYMLIGTGTAIISEKYFSRNTMVVIFAVFVATFIYEMFTYVFLRAIWGRGRLFNDVATIILPTCLYNGVFSIFINYIINKIFCVGKR